MTPEIILALSALMTAIVTGVISIITSRKSARKDEVQLLREEVARLQKRISDLEKEKEDWQTKYDQLHEEVILLRDENSELRAILKSNHIEFIAITAKRETHRKHKRTPVQKP